MNEKVDTEEKEDNSKELEAFLNAEDAKGNYANYIRVGHTSSEFIIDFFMKGDQAFHTSRILVSPSNIKDFAKTIQKNIERYEENFDMELPESPSGFVENGIKKKDD